MTAILAGATDERSSMTADTRTDTVPRCASSGEHKNTKDGSIKEASTPSKSRILKQNPLQTRSASGSHPHHKQLVRMAMGCIGGDGCKTLSGSVCLGSNPGEATILSPGASLRGSSFTRKRHSSVSCRWSDRRSYYKTFTNSEGAFCPAPPPLNLLCNGRAITTRCWLWF